jgi:hypothetical protein
MGMKTIHLENQDVTKGKVLVKELYDYTLKDDPEFHFFFEPALIIRITTEDCLTRAKSYLQARNIIFKEYDYPFPPLGPPENFGEERYGIVVNYYNLFLAVFHANSVAALTMSEEEHFKYLERIIHTAFNPKSYSREKEGVSLLQLAALKLGYNLGYQLIPNK